jgi:hypothetical protein
MGSSEFHSTNKDIVCYSFNTPFWLSADVKPMCKDQEHAMPCQRMLALSLSLSLCVYSVISMARASLQNGG